MEEQKIKEHRTEQNRKMSVKMSLPTRAYSIQFYCLHTYVCLKVSTFVCLCVFFHAVYLVLLYKRLFVIHIQSYTHVSMLANLKVNVKICLSNCLLMQAGISEKLKLRLKVTRSQST